jgi:integrase
MPKGERLRQSTGTTDKKQAQELHDKIKAQLWEIDKLGAKPTYTWDDAVIRWLSEKSHKKSLHEDKNHLRWLYPYLHGKQLIDITKTVIDSIKAEKIATGVKPATTNRMLAVLRSLLNIARTEWEWLDNVPTIKLLPVDNARLRWLSEEEMLRLFAELPSHLLAMAKFALLTGLRESNVVRLRWAQVDFKNRLVLIPPNQSKSGKELIVPLTIESIAILREQRFNQSDYVFTYNGKPVTRANNHAWRKALKRASIENFTWHDLRHTWATWHRLNGTSLEDLKDLGHWADLQMPLRYAHVSNPKLAQAANNISIIHGTNKSQHENTISNVLVSR